MPQNPLYKPHIFKKGDKPIATRERPSTNAVQNYKGHVVPCAPIKSRQLVETQKKQALDLCAGYPMDFSLPRNRIMEGPEIAAHVRTVSHRQTAQEEAELYAANARPQQPKESDYRSSDPNRQVLDPRTQRPMIESVLSGTMPVPPRKSGTRSFPQAYHTSEVADADIPRAARHEMESMPASYKTNLVRTLCMLYPKFTAETRIARQKAAHQVNGPFAGQGLSHSPSRAGIAEKAGKQATQQVTSRPNNIRVVSLMRQAGGFCP